MRTSYFLDIDNLCGGGRPELADVEAMFALFDEVCAPCSDDQVYCAGTWTSALYAKSLRDGYCTRVGHGLDGADLKLLDLADIDVLQRQFDRVVIGSGDHIFAGLARDLVARDLQVDVFARRGSVARDLCRAIGFAGSVIELDPPSMAWAA